MLHKSFLENRAKLANIQLFDCVDIATIEFYLEKCDTKNITINEVLLSPQQQNDNIYILLQGKLRVHLDSLEHPVLNYIKEGECVGEVSIIDSQEPSAYVVADTDAELLVLSQNILWAMVNISHTIAKNLLYVLTRRLRHDHGVISDNVELQRQLQHHAVIDGLTGIHNRRWFDACLAEKIKTCQENAQALSLLLVDIDYFKNFNDTFGHLAGDKVICAVADVLSLALQHDDLLARFGGDEFVIALHDSSEAVARRIATRLKQKIAALTVNDHQNQPLPKISITIGISVLSAGDNDASLFERTDKALYAAKEKGRDCIASLSA